MILIKSAFWLFSSLVLMQVNAQKVLYGVTEAEVGFISEAPLETIRASTKALQGLLDLRSGTFAFKLGIQSFDGFNSPLQKEHFYENYMETHLFPDAKFTGKMIDPVVGLTSKYQKFRAKGKFEIHGRTKELLVDVSLSQLGNDILFLSSFNLELKDFGISIPRIVKQKISEVILVSVEGRLSAQ